MSTVTYLIPVGMDVPARDAPVSAAPAPSGGVADLLTLLADREGAVLVGDNHAYSYELENRGQVDLTNVRVTVRLDEGMEYISSSGVGEPRIDGRTIEFPVGTVGVGQRSAFQFIVRPGQAGEYRVIAEASADQTASPVRDDEVTVVTEP